MCLAEPSSCFRVCLSCLWALKKCVCQISEQPLKYRGLYGALARWQLLTVLILNRHSTNMLNSALAWCVTPSKFVRSNDYLFKDSETVFWINLEGFKFICTIFVSCLVCLSVHSLAFEGWYVSSKRG